MALGNMSEANNNARTMQLDVACTRYEDEKGGDEEEEEILKRTTTTAKPKTTLPKCTDFPTFGDGFNDYSSQVTTSANLTINRKISPKEVDLRTR